MGPANGVDLGPFADIDRLKNSFRTLALVLRRQEVTMCDVAESQALKQRIVAGSEGRITLAHLSGVHAQILISSAHLTGLDRHHLQAASMTIRAGFPTLLALPGFLVHRADMAFELATHSWVNARTSVLRWLKLVVMAELTTSIHLSHVAVLEPSKLVASLGAAVVASVIDHPIRPAAVRFFAFTVEAQVSTRLSTIVAEFGLVGAEKAKLLALAVELYEGHVAGLENRLVGEFSNEATVRRIIKGDGDARWALAVRWIDFIARRAQTINLPQLDRITAKHKGVASVRFRVHTGQLLIDRRCRPSAARLLLGSRSSGR